LDEEKSKHVGVAKQDGFGGAFLHSFEARAQQSLMPPRDVSFTMSSKYVGI
jgi:hypothetical protein